MGKSKNNWKGIYFIAESITFIAALAIVYLVSLIKSASPEDLIRNLVMTAIGIAVIGYLLRQRTIAGTLDYDNGEHLLRFWFFLWTGMIIAAACVFLPAGGWPFLVIFVTLSLYSDSITGIVSSCVLLLISVLLSGAELNIFILYFISGIMAVSFFQNLDIEFRIGIPVLCTMMVLMVCETANIVIYENTHLGGDMFVIPVVNAIVSNLLLIGILKGFSSSVIFKYHISYLELTDPECELLVNFKTNAREEYYQCMHAAYFCDRIARKLSMDADALKAAGFYNKIGRSLANGDTYEAVEQMLKENEFPPMVGCILREYLLPEEDIILKETAVLVFADAVIAAIMPLFSQDMTAAPDYVQIIESIFQNVLESGILNKCQLTLQELHTMKSTFIEEKLYYDFLH